MSELIAPTPAGKYMVDVYDNWARDQGVPVHAAPAFDLNTVETKPWARMEVDGAFCHLTGRCDYLTIYLLDLKPGAKTAPQKHLFEAVFYVVSGRGSASVTTADGVERAFEFGPRSLFAIPMNAPYRLFNGSGKERARIAVVSDMRYLMNLYRNEAFLFANPVRFADREGRPEHFQGKADFVPVKPGRHMWETNFVPDVAAFDLKEWKARGADAKSIRFLLADCMIGVHASELPVGTYKKAHRHLPGYCIFAVSGEGYTLQWFDGDKDYERIPWTPGVVYAPGHYVFHQHFNTGRDPARYLAVQYGSVRYPMVREKAFIYDTGADTSIKNGGSQIEYEDQDPRIHALFLEESKKNGVAPRMDAFVKT